MQEKDIYNLFTFHSTHSALVMERVLKAEGLGIKIIPVPRVISSSCGLAARTFVGDIENIKTIIQAEEIEIDECYIMTDNNNIRQV